jgi:hypothetical protein
MRQIAVRSVLRLVDGLGLYLVGLITMLASGERRQRLGDMAAKTIVTTVEVERKPGGIHDLPEPAPVVPFNPPEPDPEPKPVLPPAAVAEPPPFEPYRVPDQPVAPPVVQKVPVSPVQAAEAPEPYTPAEEEPRIELVPDPPAEGEEPEQPRIQIVSPMDVVMGEDDEDPQDPPPPQSA